MKKTLILATVALMLATALIGCNVSRAPIDAATFAEKAEAAGYRIQNAIDQLAEGKADDYLIAIAGAETINYQIEFIVVPTVQQAITAYQDNRADFEAQKGSTSSYSSVSLGNVSSYKLTSNGRYFVISRIENTFVYINASVEYKDGIVDFLKTIGY